MMNIYNTLKCIVNTYNALYVVMVMVLIRVDPNLAYNYDYNAL